MAGGSVSAPVILPNGQVMAQGFICWLERLAGNADLRRGLAELGLWAKSWETIEAEGATNLGDAVAEIGGELAAKGCSSWSLIYSKPMNNSGEDLVNYANEAGHCAVVRLLAAEEVDFDYEGGIRFEPIERGEPLTIDAQAIRSAYLQSLNVSMKTAGDRPPKLSANILFARNDDPPVAVLRRLTREYLR